MVKKIPGVLLAALIGLGMGAAVPVVQAGDPESCWGRCDTESVPHEALQRWWNVAGADDAESVPDEALQRWWNVAGADDAEVAQSGELRDGWVNARREDNKKRAATALY